jgi:hypothetical protein
MTMFRTLIAAAAFATLALASALPSHAQKLAVTPDQFAAPEESAADGDVAEDRLLIVNRNSGRVIYDDGRNDLYCATQRIVVGYTCWGRPIYRRTMRCR